MLRSHYYTRNGKQYGPVAIAELRNLLRNSRLSPTDLVWTEGMPEWKPATEIPELDPAASPAAAEVNSATSPPGSAPGPAAQGPAPSIATPPATSPRAVSSWSPAMRAVRERGLQFLEGARQTAVATAQHLGQIVTCGIAQGKIRLARREAMRCRVALGQKLRSAGLGNEESRRIVHDLEARIRNAKAAGTSSRPAETELRAALAALAEPALESDQAPPELAAEFGAARSARNALLEARQSATDRRTGMRSLQARHGLRIGIGYACLFLIISSMVWASRDSDRASMPSGTMGQNGGGSSEEEGIPPSPVDAATGLVPPPVDVHQSSICWRCNGSGQSDCDQCFGTGKRTCFNCNGSGTTPNRMQCFQCNGSGQQKCSFCQYGKVQCPQCQGRGQL